MTRSWWGWGHVEDAVTGAELDDLAGLVATAMGRTRPPAIDPVDVTDVPVADPRLRVPDVLGVDASIDPVDRIAHAHGQAFRDVAAAFAGHVPDTPDAVVRPRTSDEVRAILDWASDAGVAVVPWGGGTSVVGGVNPPADRPVVALSLEHLAGLVEVDQTSLSAHVEAGAFGPDIDRLLHAHGLTLRHFPQSWEFSTLGGWIATRSGGHFATGPTHIDDFVEAIGAETPSGRWDSRRLPASGAGPSPDRFMLGSEGALGVITDAWIRVQRRPTFRARANVLFGTVAAAAEALRALAQSELQPANARILDHAEAALAGAGDGSHAILVLGFESADHPLGAWLDRAVELCADHGGLVEDRALTEGDTTGEAAGAGAQWRRTFLRAPYLRDALIQLGMVVETFETAVTWDRFADATANLAAVARANVAEVCGVGSVSMRVTHAYPDGAAPYFTVIAPGRPGEQVAMWDEIKAAVSDAILEVGATITHHHAVGRDHAPWYVRQMPAPFLQGLRAAKRELDPQAIMNPGVLGL